MKQYILRFLIITGSSFLIYESAQFAISQGIPVVLACLVAVTLEIFCIVASTYKETGARCIVFAFVALVLFASSYNRVAPILNADGISKINNLRLAAAEQKVQSIENKIAFFASTKQKTNHAIQTKNLTSAMAERDAVLNEIKDEPASTVNMVSMVANIIGIVFLRLFVQLSNIFCASKLDDPRLNRRIRKKQNEFEAPKPVQKVFEIDSKDAKLLELIDQKGGELRRPEMLQSKVLKAVDAYDMSAKRLFESGFIEIKKNGTAANTVYRLV